MRISENIRDLESYWKVYILGLKGDKLAIAPAVHFSFYLVLGRGGRSRHDQRLHLRINHVIPHASRHRQLHIGACFVVTFLAYAIRLCMVLPEDSRSSSVDGLFPGRGDDSLGLDLHATLTGCSDLVEGLAAPGRS